MPNFQVESGELSVNIKATDHHAAAIEGLRLWDKAEENLKLNNLLTVTQYGPRGGKIKSEGKMFHTQVILQEMGLKYILSDGDIRWNNQ